MAASSTKADWSWTENYDPPIGRPTPGTPPLQTRCDNRSFDLYLANRDASRDINLITSEPSNDLLGHLESNEAMRVEVMLLAGPTVRSALGRYGDTLKQLWRVVASGTSTADMPASTAAYHALIDAMQREIARPQP